MTLSRAAAAGLGLKYRALVFLGSFLLFQVELIVARLLLPGFGSSASVWTTCLMFYQGVLFVGYLYAGKAGALIREGRYRWTHLAFVLVPMLAFPFRLVSLDLPPVLAVTVALTLSVGWPFLALSTTSVVAQGWLTRTDHPAKNDPYFLYGISNAGALLALLTYPFLVEPLLDMRSQQLLWYAAYGGFAVLMAFCVPPRRADAASAEPATTPPTAAPEPVAGSGAPGRVDRLYWLMLTAGANALLMAATSAVTLDASVPLLWILPLTVYLVTLILCFARRPLSRRGLDAWSLVSVLGALSTLLGVTQRKHLQASYIALHSLILFVGCLVLHWNLAQARPRDTRHLGAYYLNIALGGWLGSVLIGLVVPVVFRKVPLAYLEYAIAWTLVLGAFLVRDRTRLGAFIARRPVWAAASAGGLVLAFALIGALVQLASKQRLDGSRTFYGLYSVKNEQGLRWFHHGNTVHGLESLAPDEQGEPLAYYHRGSPIAQLLRSEFPRKDVAVVGLGVGAMATYARDEESWDFFELDDEVERLARAHFSFLERARGSLRVVTGDARLTLEQQGKQYDLIVIDAFSSDFVPTHLLTEEALSLYRRKLRPGGLLVCHISNRLFDLAPVLARTGQGLGMKAYTAGGIEPSEEESARGRYTSVWLALTDQPAGQAWLSDELGWSPVALSPTVQARRPWTDGYINLFHALRW